MLPFPFYGNSINILFHGLLKKQYNCILYKISRIVYTVIEQIKLTSVEEKILGHNLAKVKQKVMFHNFIINKPQILIFPNNGN